MSDVEKTTSDIEIIMSDLFFQNVIRIINRMPHFFVPGRK